MQGFNNSGWWVIIVLCNCPKRNMVRSIFLFSSFTCPTELWYMEQSSLPFWLLLKLWLIKDVYRTKELGTITIVFSLNLISVVCTCECYEDMHLMIVGKLKKIIPMMSNGFWYPYFLLMTEHWNYRRFLCNIVVM